MGVASGWCTHGTVRACDACVCVAACVCVLVQSVELEVLATCVWKRRCWYVCETAVRSAASLVRWTAATSAACWLCVWCSCMTCRLHWRAAVVTMLVCVCVCGGAVQVCCTQP